mmetsp:Transcript_12142/g.25064  ORF Transcript_12142/g.25064 Transcript_12142/m.25064 type:complete len:214 (+) Transcript_12142:329-970(+)
MHARRKGGNTGVHVTRNDMKTVVPFKFRVVFGIGGTLFGGSNVNLVALELGNSAVETSNDPRTLAETGPFETKAASEKNEGDGGGQEGHGEGRCHKLPCDGGNNGGDESTEQSGLEEFLGQICNSENVIVSLVEFDGGDTGNDEEAQSDAHLSTNHETGQVAAIAFEKKVTGFLGPGGLGALFLGHSGNGKEGNLHTLEHTDNRHEEEEEDDS